ncbi:Aldehyde dehydrogenase [Friedmanniomyces simplex]|uniref:Aldehyde dehydrogenase n=2 Tax=Friedmanniomyces simplex TaxID=329884 RepID=A0A4U0VLZ6_9PEZI|nr:Aldehyde dehydrogenase [Friedmanniomyces simplex]
MSGLFVELKTPHSGKYMQPTGLFINNEFVKGVDGKTLEVINPSTEKVITSVHEATEKDVDIAVSAARKAFDGPWRKETPENRGKLLVKLADLFEKNLDLLAAVESLDNGKAISMAKADIGMCVGCLRYYGGWADKITGKVIDTTPDTFNYIRKEPVGVCGQTIPWNFPLLMRPVSPPGVVNVISGFGKIAGAALASHMDVDKVAFTGSTVVGRTVLKAAASSNLKKVTLELGGKSPNIVFEDADIDNAISWVNFGIFFNSGQCCCAGSRIYVQEGIYDKFVQRFKERALKNVVSDPFARDTFQGPLVSQVQFDRVMSYIKAGKDAGAKVEIGGERKGDKGYFIEPTIFSNISEEMSIMQEEIFGPVCSISKFKTKDEVIAVANKSNYGLAAAVHTKNLNTAIDMPFGGYKESGIGRELGEAALDNYLQTKSVSIRLGNALFA